MYIIRLLLGAMLVAAVDPTVAQKLPNVQEGNLRTPDVTKIDGKATEWSNQLKAYNKATEIFYTISNDNDKLYLTVQATDLDIINKIICAGITLTINGKGKMKEEEGVAITYPALDKNNFPRNDHGTLDGAPLLLDKPDNWSADSFMVVLNKQFTAKVRDIRVEGVKEIPNHLLSIYNPEGIKAIALFDDKTVFTYELAMPLKYLGLSVGSPKPFSYSIKLTGMNPDMHDYSREPGIALRSQRNALRPGIQRYGKRDGFYYLEGPTAARVLYLFFPTSFWGEYTLAR